MADRQPIEPTRGFDWRRLLPRYWSQNQRTDRVWDAVLNQLLDTQQVELNSSCTVNIGGFSIWVASWPYAYGTASSGRIPSHGLPMVKTRLRLRNAVYEAILRSGAEQSA